MRSISSGDALVGGVRMALSGTSLFGGLKVVANLDSLSSIGDPKCCACDGELGRNRAVGKVLIISQVSCPNSFSVIRFQRRLKGACRHRCSVSRET